MVSREQIPALATSIDFPVFIKCVQRLTPEKRQQVDAVTSIFNDFLESRCGEVEARRKMEVKKLDFVALNGPEAQGAERSSLLVLGADGSRVELGPTAKPGLARGLVRATLG